MGRKSDFKPDYLIPPGRILGDILDEQGIQQKELAERTGLTPKTINEIVNGKARITPDSALRFERVLGTPASFWNNAQSRYDDHKARLEEEEQLEKEVDWLENFPFLKQMIKRGWIKEASRPVLQLREILDFFSVSHVRDFRAVWQESGSVAFRLSETHKSDPFAVAAWLRQGERVAHSIPCDLFDEKEFKKALVQARELTLISDLNELIPKLRDLMAGVGVAVVFLKELKGAKINGAVRWILGDKAILQLSLRHRYADIMWFTFFHEAFHLLENKEKSWKIDGLSNIDDEEERRVNKRAADLLIPPDQYRKFLSSWNKSNEEITRFAEEIGVHSGIVVGRLQHDGKTAKKNHNKPPIRIRY